MIVNCAVIKIKHSVDDRLCVSWRKKQLEELDKTHTICL